MNERIFNKLYNNYKLINETITDLNKYSEIDLIFETVENKEIKSIIKRIKPHVAATINTKYPNIFKDFNTFSSLLSYFKKSILSGFDYASMFEFTSIFPLAFGLLKTAGVIAGVGLLLGLYKTFDKYTNYIYETFFKNNSWQIIGFLEGSKQELREILSFLNKKFKNELGDCKFFAYHIPCSYHDTNRKIDYDKTMSDSDYEDKAWIKMYFLIIDDNEKGQFYTNLQKVQSETDKEIDKIMSQIKKSVIKVGKGASDEQIKQACKELKLYRFADEYRFYLQKYGYIQFKNVTVSGLNCPDQYNVVILTNKIKSMVSEYVASQIEYVLEYNQKKNTIIFVEAMEGYIVEACLDKIKNINNDDYWDYVSDVSNEFAFYFETCSKRLPNELPSECEKRIYHKK